MTAMEQIMQDGIGANTRTKSPAKQYQCEKCHDTGWMTILEDGHEFARRCECRKRRKAEEALKASGIAIAFRDKSLGNYRPKNATQADALNRAEKFVEIFGQYRMHMNFLLMGQNGAGKTHLAIGIANALIKKNVLVRYVTFYDLLDAFSNAKKERDLDKVVQQYQKAELLVIDDIFRTTIREWNGKKNPLMSHIDSMFRIINYRYENIKGTIITCERTTDELLKMDQAIGGRLVECARGNIIDFKDPMLDHRIHGQ
jgi:DNA replication protein DnaC